MITRKDIIDNTIIKIMNEYIKRRKDNIAATLTIDLPKILDVKEQEYIVNIITGIVLNLIKIEKIENMKFK